MDDEDFNMHLNSYLFVIPLMIIIIIFIWIDFKKEGKINRDENVDDFLLNLYEEVSVEKRWQPDELSDLVSATKEMILRIVNKAYEGKPAIEELTKVYFAPVGSMADGTSIIDPDEFDFTIAYVYSPNSMEARPSSNLREFSLPKIRVRPNDSRFKQIYFNDKLLQPEHFCELNFYLLEDGIAKARETGPVQRGDKSLYLCASDGNDIFYGMQGPAFHLHNLLRWRSPNRKTDFVISVDMVPAIQIEDKNLNEGIPLFKLECPTGKHTFSRPEHYLLTPYKKVEVANFLFPEGNNSYSNDKRDFFNNHFMLSFPVYEKHLLKQWKREKSMYHNWFICYVLIKCFGKLDHDCRKIVKYDKGMRSMNIIGTVSYPEKHESIPSFSWKNLVFTKAMKQFGKKLSLSQCFDCLTSEFEDENLKKMEPIQIESFCCPPEILESIEISGGNSAYAPFVEKMKCVKSMMNGIKADADYNYEKYKKRLVEICPGLTPHLM